MRTPDQHINQILTRAAWDAKEKYKAGQEEHGGKLWRKPIMEYIGDEIIDMVIYWYTFREQWNEIRDELSWLEMNLFDSEEVPKWVQERVTQILNLVYHGNMEGIQEEERDAK